MDVLKINVEDRYSGRSLSLNDLRTKLFGKKSEIDRAPVISEEKYTEKTLEGNWFERRVTYTPPPDDWKTVYEVDYKPHINETWMDNQAACWENKLNFEDLRRDLLTDHHGEAYRNNMTTTYDLTYNILPKRFDGTKLRTYNARKLKWLPEQDLTEAYGNLTQFGLRDSIQYQTYQISEKGIADCRWKTTYKEEIGKPGFINTERITQFNKRRVDMNVPDLRHFENKTSEIQSC